MMHASQTLLRGKAPIAGVPTQICDASPCNPRVESGVVNTTAGYEGYNRWVSKLLLPLACWSHLAHAGTPWVSKPLSAARQVRALRWSPTVTRLLVQSSAARATLRSANRSRNAAAAVKAANICAQTTRAVNKVLRFSHPVGLYRRGVFACTHPARDRGLYDV